MAELIKLFVNGVEVEVESGKNLIDAIGIGTEIGIRGGCMKRYLAGIQTDMSANNFTQFDLLQQHAQRSDFVELFDQ